MRFLIDEDVGPKLAARLRSMGHDVASVHEDSRGATDDQIVQRAHSQQRLLVTCDKDFGEKVWREGYPHRGIVLLRLQDQRQIRKIEAVERLLDLGADRLADQFVVVTEVSVRFARRV
jgi:predicted nuclease of predicted toxin-antitoxin system